MRAIQIVCSGLFAVAILAAVPCAAQDQMPPETEAPPPAVPMHPHKHARPSTVSPAPAQTPDPPVQAAQAAPEQPHWPVNDQPAQATVTWDSHGLSIDAANSSLQQILKDVSTATGASVDGLSGDERVFGVYGPGQARAVLSQLLQGAGYNVMMVGDQGQGAPRQIVLTQRKEGDDQAGQNRNNGNNNAGDDDSSDSSDDDQPVNVHPGFPGGPPRTPQQFQQMQQERQERMRQLQQQQQNQQNQNPQN